MARRRCVSKPTSSDPFHDPGHRNPKARKLFSAGRPPPRERGGQDTPVLGWTPSKHAKGKGKGKKK